MLEGKPALGGRAYSFADAETGDFVDNGQHVLMGCYTETLDFLDRIGARDQLVFHRDLEIEMLDATGRARDAQDRAPARTAAHERRAAALSASDARASGCARWSRRLQTAARCVVATAATAPDDRRDS